jgi:signal peptidase I
MPKQQSSVRTLLLSASKRYRHTHKEFGSRPNSDTIISEPSTFTIPTERNTISFEHVSWKEMTSVLALAVSFALLLKIMVIEVDYVPSESMIPTLKSGDFIVVDKLAYSFGLPERIPFTSMEMPLDIKIATGTINFGDVVVFDFPWEGASGRFIKRIGGIPTQYVRLKDGRFSVHNSRAGRTDTWMIPQKGQTLSITQQNLPLYKNPLLHEGNTVEIQNNIVHINGVPAATYTFKQNYYFAAGDNEDKSWDSRFWGLLPENVVLGKASHIYWSKEPATMFDVRTERLFTAIR